MRKSTTRRTPKSDPIAEVWEPKTHKRGDFDLVAIDPGDVYTGVAFFKQNDDLSWFCLDAQEFSPHEFEDALMGSFLEVSQAPPPIVVFERWRLYADHAKEKTGSEFEASQHIGVIKYIVRQHNDHVALHNEAEAAGKLLSCELPARIHCMPVFRPQPATIFGQLADIKKPTAGICRKKGIRSIAKAIAKEHYENRDHVIDAELHGWCYILKELDGQPAK